MKNPLTLILAPVLQFLFSPIAAGWHRANHEEKSKGALFYIKDVNMLMTHIDDIAAGVCEQHVGELRNHMRKELEKEVESLSDEHREWLVNSLDARIKDYELVKYPEDLKAMAITVDRIIRGSEKLMNQHADEIMAEMRANAEELKQESEKS